MHNCIFTPHCTEMICDRSCPILVETSYLLERNGISLNSDVFKSPPNGLNSTIVQDLLSSALNDVKAYKTANTIADAEYITYCAICHNWQGNRLHCNVYNLKYSGYLEAIKQSWTTKAEPEELEYMRIWANTAKVLIISNLDFVNFNDFESQTLLNLIQSRISTQKSTIIVFPGVAALVGKGEFFKILKNLLYQASNKGGDRR